MRRVRTAAVLFFFVIRIGVHMAIPFPEGPFNPPSGVEKASPETWPPPQAKKPPKQVAPHMQGLRTDDEFDDFIKSNKGRTVRPACEAGARLSPIHARHA